MNYLLKWLIQIKKTEAITEPVLNGNNKEWAYMFCDLVGHTTKLFAPKRTPQHKPRPNLIAAAIHHKETLHRIADHLLNTKSNTGGSSTKVATFTAL